MRCIRHLGNLILSERRRKLAEVAEALNAGHPKGRLAGGALPGLFFFTDDIRTPDPLAAIAALPNDCGVVFRHYRAPNRTKLARAVVSLCRNENRDCLIGGDVWLAEHVDADGVHFSEAMLHNLAKRPAFVLVTAAAHNAKSLEAAQALALDAVFLSPVFETESHPGANVLGAEGFAALVKTTTTPTYALGGITPDTATGLRSSGAVGLAAIGALL